MRLCSAMASIMHVPVDKRLSCRAELGGRGSVYCALDRRREWLIFSQRMRGVQQCIDELVGEDAKLSSLYESAAKTLRAGYHGSFRVDRIALDELPSYHAAHRERYRRVVVNAQCAAAWVVGPD